MVAKELRKEYDRKRRWKLKLDAIKAYGGHCSVCGITNPQYLTIDHIHGGGAEHRKEVIGDKKQAGWNFYLWLKKENYPPGFQPLCWNHNASKQTHNPLCEEPYIFYEE
jgi:hypothetical protein